VPQEEASQTIGFFEVTPQTGEIKGNGAIELSCRFTCQVRVRVRVRVRAVLPLHLPG